MSELPRIVVCSDWHIGNGRFVKSSTVEGDDDWAVEQIVQLSRKYPGSWLAAPGDLIHSPRPDHLAVEKLFSVIRAFEGRIVAVAGQHDGGHLGWLQLLSQTSGIPLVPYPLPLIRGINFCPNQEIFLSWLRDATDPQTFRILLVHQQWKCFLDVPGSLDESILSDHLEPGTLVISGDLHRFRMKTLDNEITLISPGSVQRTRIQDEPGCWLVLEVRPDLSVRIEKIVPFLCRPVLSFRVSKDTNINSIEETVVREFDEAVSKGMPREVARPVVELIPEEEEASLTVTNIRSRLDKLVTVVVKPFLVASTENRISVDVTDPDWMDRVIEEIVPEKFAADVKAIWRRLPAEVLWQDICKRFGVKYETEDQPAEA